MTSVGQVGGCPDPTTADSPPLDLLLGAAGTIAGERPPESTKDVATVYVLISTAHHRRPSTKEQNVMANGSGSEKSLQQRTAQIASKGTAREVYLKAISEDRRFRLLPPSGETLAIVGARPPVKA